jgi:hypothetical protein
MTMLDNRHRVPVFVETPNRLGYDHGVRKDGQLADRGGWHLACRDR